MSHAISVAVEDIRNALKRRAVWVALAAEDIGDQHRTTSLGPLWLVLNYLLFVGTFIVLFSHQFDIRVYSGYAATGMLVWLYISEIINRSTTLFLRESSFIKGTTLPLSVYVFRLAMQAAIRCAYAVAGMIGILIVARTPIGANAIWALAGVAIILLATIPTIVLFAFGGAFFPDLQFIVQNLIRVGMFLTPIFWGLEPVSGLRGHLYQWNPFTYFLETVRQPIVFDTIPVNAYMICLGMVCVLWPLALLALGRLREKVIFVI